VRRYFRTRRSLETLHRAPHVYTAPVIPLRKRKNKAVGSERKGKREGKKIHQDMLQEKSQVSI